MLIASPTEVAIAYLLGLLGSAALVGAIVGWLIGRTRRALLTTAAAGLAFALGPGHNIPALGGTPVVVKEVVIVSATVVVASIVLVEVHARLAGRLTTIR